MAAAWNLGGDVTTSLDNFEVHLYDYVKIPSQDVRSSFTAFPELDRVAAHLGDTSSSSPSSSFSFPAIPKPSSSGMPPTTTPTDLSALQRKVWEGTIPLEIRLASAECRTYDQSDPYLVRPLPRASAQPAEIPYTNHFSHHLRASPSVHPRHIPSQSFSPPQPQRPPLTRLPLARSRSRASPTSPSSSPASTPSSAPP
jgi:hypothetical protein